MEGTAPGYPGCPRWSSRVLRARGSGLDSPGPGCEHKENIAVESPVPPRRILSLWFPRLAAERVLRVEPGLAGQPLAVVAEVRGALVLASLVRLGPRAWFARLRRETPAPYS